MTTQEVKSVLHESIENIDDEKFLEAIKVIIETKYKSLSSLRVSEKQKKILDESSKEIDEGKFYTDEEAKKISAKWLKD